jgi:hypothetical protein
MGISMMELKIHSNQDYFNPAMQQEIFNLIEKVYFIDFSAKTDPQSPPQQVVVSPLESDLLLLKLNQKIQSSLVADNLDVADFELKKLTNHLLPPTTTTTTFPQEKEKAHLLKNTILKLEIQRDIVNRQVSDAILKNSPAFTAELTRITDLKLLLEDSHQLSCISRRSLLMSRILFVVPALKLIKKQNRKLNLLKLIDSEEAFKSFRLNTKRIVELIEQKEYPQAIDLCEQADKQMDKYAHFKCIHGLKERIKQLYEQLEVALNENIFKMCQAYDEPLYAKIISAFFSLGKIESLMDKVNANFFSAIDLIAQQSLLNIVVRKFISQESQGDNVAKINAYIDELKKRSYTELFELIQADDYKSCLIDLCQNLWQIMKNYYKICICNYNNFLNNIDSSSSSSTSSLNFKEVFKTIQKRIPANLDKIWCEIQQQTSAFLCSMNLGHYKFDEFIPAHDRQQIHADRPRVLQQKWRQQVAVQSGQRPDARLLRLVSSVAFGGAQDVLGERAVAAVSR